MTLRKTNIDNGVEYIRQREKSQERDNKPKMIKKTLLTREQGKKLSQNNKKLIKNIAPEGFGILK